MSLIQQLVEKGILEKTRATALDYEVKNSQKREEEIILEKKIVSEDFLFTLKSESLNIPLKTVSPDEISLKELEIIPEESAKYYQMIPLDKKDNLLEIGMVYPEDWKTREALEFLARQSGFEYQIFLITKTNFEEILKKYRSLKEEVSRAIEELEEELKTEKEKTGRETFGEDVERIAEDAPISKVVANIIRHAVDGNASDVHIEPGREKIRVRFRLDGVLHSSLFLSMKYLPAIAARVKILANLRIDEARIPQDGRFSTKLEERNVDFRVSTFPTTLGEKVVIRILDPTQRKIDFKELGITGRNLKVLERSIKKPYGMILSAGPTGSGKTTTLYALLGLLNKEDVNVITLEDPVEYFIEGVSQSQVKPEIGYDFSNGLRHILRQDPDIVMVGEIRDEETASLAIHAALTGHILLSTLHTADTIGAVPRLIDMGIKPFLIPPSLNSVVAQRLVRKLCPYCKKKIKPKEEIKKVIMDEVKAFPASTKEEVKIPSPFYIYEPGGCKRCNNIGYAGRIGVFEILEMTDQLADIIIKEPSETAIRKEAERQGMVTMRQDGILKVLEGVTSLEELFEVVEAK